MADFRNRVLKNPRLWQFVLAGFWLALFAGTHIPNNVPILPEHGGDKLVHFAAFAVLATLLAFTWQRAAGHLTARHLAVAWIVIILYAAVDEWTQTFVGRHASIADWAADAFGALLALALFAWFRHNLSTRRLH